MKEGRRERLVADTQFTNSTHIVQINWVQRCFPQVSRTHKVLHRCSY